MNDGKDGLRIKESAGAVSIEVAVQPRASRNEITGVREGALRIRLTSPPVEGAANRLCIEFLAKSLGIPKSAISILSGDKARHKIVRIEGATAAEVAALVPAGSEVS